MGWLIIASVSLTRKALIVLAVALLLLAALTPVSAAFALPALVAVIAAAIVIAAPRPREQRRDARPTILIALASTRLLARASLS
jgi:membrane protein implicated in regulation of membrane protease activity